jgi:hypothetical protein
MRGQHVEMALVDRDVGRLADRAAGMVQIFRQIGDADEVAEILHRRVAPAAVEVAHEGRAVDRGEHGLVSADLHRLLGVARMLGEAGGRGGAKLAGESAGDAHALALDIGAGVLPALQRRGVLREGDADLLEHGLGVLLDDRERLLVEDVEDGQVPRQHSRRLDPMRRALRPPRGPAAAPAPALRRRRQIQIAHRPLPNAIHRRSVTNSRQGGAPEAPAERLQATFARSGALARIPALPNRRSWTRTVMKAC